MNRPQGVTILAWLAIIGGVLGVFASIAVVGVGLFALFAGSAAGVMGGVKDGAAAAGAGIFALFMSIWLIALSIFEIVFGVGALNLKPWAWTVGVWWCYISAISNVLSLFSRGGLFGAVIGIAIDIALLYYLFRPDVRAAFGKLDKQPPSFIVPIFETMDGWFNKGAAPQGAYTPPTAPPPAGYAPPTAPPAPPTYAPPAPPAPPTDPGVPPEQPPV